MNVTLTPDLEKFIDHKVNSGEFPSAEALTLEAVRLYRELEEQHAELKAELQRRLAQLDRGERKPWDVEQFLAAAHKRHAVT